MEKVNKSSAFRYERKFVVKGFYNKEPEIMIKLHPALFTEIHHQRSVNNIYFDTFDFRNYRENIDGCADRIKVRIRWYGELFGEIKKPVLELKIKKAWLGRKESYRLQNFSLTADFTSQAIADVISRSELPPETRERLKSLYPVLLNCYKRKYFLSADKQYRITMDRDMEYHGIRNNGNLFISKFTDPHTTIIELKYGTQVDNYANEISTLFPFRMTKSSKYVNGVDRFFGSTI